MEKRKNTIDTNQTQTRRRHQPRSLLHLEESSPDFVIDIADLLPDIVYIYDLAEQRVVYMNAAITAVLGYSVAEVRAMDGPLLYDLLHAEDLPQVHARYSQLNTRCPGTFITFECRVRHANGEWRSLVVRERVLRHTMHGQPLQVLGIAQDMNGHRTMEQTLRSALEYKDSLLREMHHRVKNNLQFLSSLFHLQSDALLNPADQAVFQEVQQRIQAIALAHNMLLPTNEHTHINLGKYLGQLLMPLHDPARCGVTLEFTIAGTVPELSMSQAVACGLIMNELVINAFKHAFPDDSYGTITVSLETTHADTILLTVSDNGIGLPEHVDLNHATRRGLGLVRTFTRQLRGNIQVAQTPGTRITISFPGRSFC